MGVCLRPWSVVVRPVFTSNKSLLSLQPQVLLKQSSVQGREGGREREREREKSVCVILDCVVNLCFDIFSTN